MKIIPAIDILDGKCVRLTEGDYATQKIYYTQPIEFAKQLEDHGIEYLHVVDLDGAKSKHIVNYPTLTELCTKTNLKVDFGGGIKTDQDIKIAFDCGASQVTAGSIAVKEPTMFLAWLARYGSDKIILGADCKAGRIYTNGWLESSELSIFDFIKTYEVQGVTQVICTDISKDGNLQGPAHELYAEILRTTQVQVIASGGVTSLEDLQRLKSIGCAGAIIGKALYEGKISLQDLVGLNI
ncbi:MAG: 1-(5-phosphoribosyl)-5-[(5-phosphoribosylamino)methylideneamino]imidazole-4-carboxamide isomerase [Saprospiraceae bacterium]